MILRLPSNVRLELLQALKEAGQREIGGILMGEHVGVNDFRVTLLTIQRGGGTIARFVRMVEDALHALTRFFKETRNDYTRFNYLGEWHSHPLFIPQPSPQDDATMMKIILDERVGATFAVLMVAKMVESQLVATLSLYTRSGRAPAILLWE
jgi:hypothetical protein